MNRLRSLSGIAVLGILLSVACREAASTGSPPPAATQTSPAATETVTAAQPTSQTPAPPGAQPSEALTQTPQPEAFVDLLATRAAMAEPAPWLVFAAAAQEGQAETLWALKAGETQVRPLTDDPVRTFAVQPQAADGSTQVAYVTGTVATGGLHGLTLKIVSLPGGQVKTLTPLTSPQTAITDQDPNDAASNYWEVSNIADAITFDRSVAWSPDGRWLAFVGAMDGPSADVYSCEIATGKIRQLTSGADQAFQLMWSPDSRWIVHTAQKEFERSGGAYEAATGIWAAAPDGSEVRTLEGPRPSELLGWVDASTLVAEGGPRMGPGGDLRQIDISTGSIAELGPSCYDMVAYDLQERVYLVEMPDVGSAGSADTLCPGLGTWKAGVYLMVNGSPTPVSNLDTADPDSLYLQWLPAFDLFMATRPDKTSIAISPAGAVLPGVAEKLPAHPITASSDGSALAWLNSYSLYVATGPAYQPVLVPGQYYSRQGIRLAWSH